MSRSRVLLVDDDSRILRIVAAYLGGEGYEVLTATSGQAFLEQAFVARPDIVVLEMAMPGMDGVEACSRIRAQGLTAAVPVVMVAGEPRDDDIERAAAAGANHLISKPFSLSGLGLVVRSLLA
ncbi:MAG: response regulator [Candidatus Dormibacteria bacterium]